MSENTIIVTESNVAVLEAPITETVIEATAPVESAATEIAVAVQPGPEQVKLEAALAAMKAQMELAEQLIQAKYPHLTIVKGSLVQDVNHEYFGNKRRVKVLCPICGAEVERATSDLHTFKACPKCIKDVRKAEKSVKKLGLAAQVAELQAKLKAQESKPEGAEAEAKPATQPEEKTGGAPAAPTGNEETKGEGTAQS